MKICPALINGELITSDFQIPIINPETKAIIGKVPALSKTQINQAFLSARQAQPQWAKLNLNERLVYLIKLKDLIKEYKNEFVTLMAQEIAKPLQDGESEVERTLDYLEYTFEEAKHLPLQAFNGEAFNIKNKMAIFERVPKGVGLTIAPFNYPLNLSLAKIIPALVMGNTIVFKPATAGSLTGSLIGQLAVKAHFPAGVFNVVTGKGSEIGDYLLTNEYADFISFTGSTRVGIKLLEIAKTKDVVLELGGKDPALVLDDEQLDYYAQEIVDGAFSFSGQRCTAIKRVITTDTIANRLVPILESKIERLSVGSAFDKTTITPLISDRAADFVFDLINEAKNSGAKIILGGERTNNLIYPTLVDFVTPDMRLAIEEPFGPVLPIIRVSDVEAMIKEANHSRFGLQASVFGQNLSQTVQVAKQLEVGTVNINGKTQRGPDLVPFLGIKSSGFGVQGIKETLFSVTRYQGIVINY